MERTRSAPLGPDETANVLRRAAEIDRAHAPFGPALAKAEHEPSLEPDEIERIAAESGISPEAVRRAIAELHGGALAPRQAHRLVATSTTVQRTFDAPADLLQDQLASSLRASGLEPVESSPHATAWEPATGLHNAIGRAIGLRGTNVWTGANVESHVYAVPGERSSVELHGDTRGLLTSIAAITGLVLAFPAAIALLVVLALGTRWGFAFQHLIAVVLVLATWAGLTALITRGASRKRVRKLRRRLEQILDGLAPAPRLH